MCCCNVVSFLNILPVLFSSSLTRVYFYDQLVLMISFVSKRYASVFLFELPLSPSGPGAAQSDGDTAQDDVMMSGGGADSERQTDRE